jgi:hypothetical protein
MMVMQGGGKMRAKARIFPSQDHSMAPTSGYSLAGLLPSISCLRFTGQLMSATCRSVQDCPIQNPQVLTSITGLDQQALLIKLFIVFEQGPGDDQHLGCQLHPGLGLNAAFALATIEHAMVKPAKAIIVV